MEIHSLGRRPLSCASIISLDRLGDLALRVEDEAADATERSNHLACLRWCGFIEARREHRVVYSRIADARVEQLLELGHALLEDNEEHVASCCHRMRFLGSPTMTSLPELIDVVQRALAAAGIAPERFRLARLEQLGETERRLYRWILESFARGGHPDVDELCDEASRLDLQIEETLATLTSLDLVHHDPATGEILVAYPFSARPRGHSVLIDGTRRVEAMCAVDALGIALPTGISATMRTSPASRSRSPTRSKPAAPSSPTS